MELSNCRRAALTRAAAAGRNARAARRIAYGALTACKGDDNGYKMNAAMCAHVTATVGRSDPAQATTKARKMVPNRAIRIAAGLRMSGAGRAMLPILGKGSLSIITPVSTNPEVTNPKYAGQYRPACKVGFFRAAATDAFQCPSIANCYSRRQHRHIGMAPPA